MRYFTNCKTAEEVKQEFKKLAKQLHPDCGGDAEEFKRMKAEFEQAFERLKKIHVNSEGKTYTKETDEAPQEFMDIIEKLLRFEGCTIELCGSWLWVSGNTKAYKDELKAMHFNWSKGKAAWYFHRDPYIKRHKGSVSMDRIREMYGSTEFSTKEKQEKLEAV